MGALVTVKYERGSPGSIIFPNKMLALEEAVAYLQGKTLVQ